MSDNFVGQIVWILEWGDKHGPYAGIVTRSGPCPVVHVFFPGMEYDVECTHWLVEDGSDRGWMAIPVDGIIPPDLFK